MKTISALVFLLTANVATRAAAHDPKCIDLVDDTEPFYVADSTQGQVMRTCDWVDRRGTGWQYRCSTHILGDSQTRIVSDNCPVSCNVPCTKEIPSVAPSLSPTSLPTSSTKDSTPPTSLPTSSTTDSSPPSLLRCVARTALPTSSHTDSTPPSTSPSAAPTALPTSSHADSTPSSASPTGYPWCEDLVDSTAKSKKGTNVEKLQRILYVIVFIAIGGVIIAAALLYAAQKRDDRIIGSSLNSDEERGHIAVEEQRIGNSSSASDGDHNTYVLMGVLEQRVITKSRSHRGQPQTKLSVTSRKFHC